MRTSLFETFLNFRLRVLEIKKLILGLLIYSFTKFCESINRGRRLLIECIELSFSCGIEEPYYCSLALHDIKQKQKLSESFHFHLNKDEFCKLFDDKSNHFASTRRCFVPITNQFRENIYIIIRVDKLYSGDFDREINRYSKKAVRFFPNKISFFAFNFPRNFIPKIFFWFFDFY